jgi:tetratricopeptide (TPR) repeat protein
MPFRYLIFSFIFIVLFSACSFLPNELDVAEQLIETAPDSALKILKNVYKERNFTDAEQARYGLLLFEALDKSKKELKPDSVIEFSINYFTKKGDDFYLSKSYFYKARMYKYAQRYEEASILYLKALDISRTSADYNLLAKIYSDLGDISVIQSDSKEARDKYNLSISYLNKAGKKIEANYKLLDIAKTYWSEGEYKSAQECYSEILQTTKDPKLLGSTYQGIGINYFFAKQFDSAQVYLKMSLNYPYDADNYAIRCFKLSDAYYMTNNYDSAIKYAKKSIEYPATSFTKKECYRILANVSYLKGDFKQMADYMTKYQEYSDSVRAIDIQTKSSIIENIHETSASMGKTRRMLVITGTFLPAIILIGLIVFLRLRKKNRGNQEIIEEQDARIDEYQEQLQLKHVQLKDALKQKIEDTRNLYTEKYKRATASEREDIDREIYSTSLHINDWKQFCALMNHTFNDLPDQLVRIFPEITQKEITWCCLYLLDLPSYDQALLLEFQQVSLYKLKQRLVQKMKFSSTKELHSYLYEIAGLTTSATSNNG